MTLYFCGFRLPVAVDFMNCDYIVLNRCSCRNFQDSIAVADFRIGKVGLFSIYF